MINNRIQRSRRILGFSLLIFGLLLFALVLPDAPEQGLIFNLFFLWVIVSFFGLGGLLISELSLKHIVKSWLIGTGIVIPLVSIFFIPLPSEYHFLLAVLIALAAVLFRRYYVRVQKSKKPSAPFEFTMWKHRSQFRKVIGGLLVVTGLLMFSFYIPIAVTHARGVWASFFYMWLAVWPIFFLIIIGCSLVLQMSFRKALGWLLGGIIVTLIPWIVILPNDLKILSITFLGLGIAIAFLYGYYCVYQRKNASNLKEDY